MSSALCGYVGGTNQTFYDLRFINNVRVAQIFWIINVCRDSSRSIIMMTAVVTNFDTYQQWHQSTRAFPPLINRSQMRLLCVAGA